MIENEMFNGNPLPIEVWKSKYANKDEIHYNEMHRRISKEFARVEEKYIKEERKNISVDGIKSLSKFGENNLILNEEEIDEKDIFSYMENKIYNYLKDFKYIIPGGSIMSSLGTENITSLSNCIVLNPPSDSYNGIMYVDTQLTSLFRRRCGGGIDISMFRPKMTTVNNAAKTTEGFIPFIERYSNTTREVAVNGRRGALMVSCHINHPDILDFIKLKRNLTKATGANLSIKITDEFMKAVESDSDFILRFPYDTKNIEEYEPKEYNKLIKVPEKQIYLKKVKAKEIWNEIINSAFICAEPGVLFWDNILQGPDGVYDEYKPVGTNPCGEIPMSQDSCRLLTINLLSFVDNPYTKKASFNVEKFQEVTYFSVRLGDDLVDLEVESIDRILSKIENDPEPIEEKIIERDLWYNLKEMGLKGRRIGIGVTAVADTLAALGYDYGSEISLKFLDSVFYIKQKTELNATIDLSILRGSFHNYSRSKEFEFKKIDPNDKGDTYWVKVFGNNKFYKHLFKNFPEEYARLLRYGRRNVSWSTMAPTGSVSILTQTTSGIEPLFKHYYIRRKKVYSKSDINYLKDIYEDELGDKWQDYFIIHPQILNCLKICCGEDYIKNIELATKEELDSLIKTLPWYNSTADKINPFDRIKVQKTIQNYTTHSISSTINLPKNTSKEMVSSIYFEAWKSNLKGLTIYIEGSRDGIMISEKKENFNKNSAFKRPKKLNAEAFLVKVKNTTFNVFIGLCNNSPYEIFIKTDSSSSGEGSIIKIEKKRYVFQQKEKDDIILSENIPDEYRAITRLVSIALRHGTEIKYIVEQLLKCDGDMFSFTKILSRILKKYILDGEISTQECTNCHSTNLVFEEGCFVCKNCGYSKCG